MQESDKREALSVYIGLSSEEPAKKAADTSAELSTIYKVYVAYECILINLLGFFTLFFQCELQGLEAKYLESHPDTPQIVADSLFGHYWLQGDLNCTTDVAKCLSKMVCGWLMIAGLLQVFINFDSLRKRLFPDDWDCPRGIKTCCMYCYFICDWYWVVLMYVYRDTISWQQIFGSALDILLRLPFAFKPSRMFKN